MRAEYEEKALAAESNTLTAQQRSIVVAAQNGLNVAVQALAGTGKTSTMVALARRMLNRRITYLAFNSANAVDARQKFAGLRHVSVSTAHALAARDLRSTDLAAKVEEGKQDGGSGPNGNADWAEFLGVRSHPHSDGGEELAPEDIVVLVKEAIKNFRNSDADAVGLDHVPDLEHPLLEVAARPSRLRREVLEYAQDAWLDKTDPASRELNFHHDDYLKIWALSRPKIHAETIIFDEAQDINPVLRKVVHDNMRPTQGPAAQVVIVGDPNQAIYGFRGAENALDGWPADIELPLNKSWRFGPEVADIANIFLKLLGSPYLMEGNDAISTPIAAIDTPDAVLGRNNTGVVAAVLAALEDGRSVHMVGGGDELQRMAEGAKELQEKGRTRKHPELVPFRSWKQVQVYVDKHDSAKQLKSFVRLVDEHGADTLIDMVGQLTENARDADLIVSTAHKSKGLEWELVQVGTDFRGPKSSTEPGQNVTLPEDEELRLAYVTATRGMRGLDLGSLQYINDLRALADERYRSQGAPTPGETPSPTEQSSAVETSEAGEEPLTGQSPSSTQPTAPEPSAFAKMKPGPASKLASPAGLLWWGGKAAGRKEASANPILVRLKFGPRGIVDVEEVATGTLLPRIRTGTELFAAAVTVDTAPPSADGQVFTPAAGEGLTRSVGAEASGDEAPAPTPDGPTESSTTSPAVSETRSPTLRVSARATDTGRHWAVLDDATGEAVWIRHPGEQPVEAVFGSRARAEEVLDSLILAPDLLVPAPKPELVEEASAAPRAQAGSVLAPTLGEVIAKESRGTSDLVKIRVCGAGGATRVFTAWNPVGAHQVQVGQAVVLSGTLGVEGPFNGQLETPVEGGSVEGEDAAHDRRNRTQPAPEGWVSADPNTRSDVTVGQRVRVLDTRHPAHASEGPDARFYSTVTVELADGDYFIGATPDARTLDFTRDQVIAVPDERTAEQVAPTPVPATDRQLDVPAALLSTLRGPDFPYHRRADRWTVDELSPRADGTP